MYKVYGSPIVTLIKNSECLIELNAMSSKESQIEKLTFSIKEINFTRDFSFDSERNRYVLKLSSDDSSSLKEGNYYYDINIFYKDGSSEVESYTNKVIIK